MFLSCRAETSNGKILSDLKSVSFLAVTFHRCRLGVYGHHLTSGVEERLSTGRPHETLRASGPNGRDKSTRTLSSSALLIRCWCASPFGRLSTLRRYSSHRTVFWQVRHFQPVGIAVHCFATAAGQFIRRLSGTTRSSSTMLTSSRLPSRDASKGTPTLDAWAWNRC
jgi:hypothetical protein